MSAYHWDARAEAANSPDSSGRSPFATGIVHWPVCPMGSAEAAAEADGAAGTCPGACGCAGPSGSAAGTGSVKFHWAVVDEVCSYCDVEG